MNCYDKSGWNNGKVYLALTEETAADHEIELKMADGNESKNFRGGSRDQRRKHFPIYAG